MTDDLTPRAKRLFTQLLEERETIHNVHSGPMSRNVWTDSQALSLAKLLDRELPQESSGTGRPSMIGEGVHVSAKMLPGLSTGPMMGPVDYASMDNIVAHTSREREAWEKENLDICERCEGMGKVPGEVGDCRECQGTGLVEKSDGPDTER